MRKGGKTEAPYKKGEGKAGKKGVERKDEKGFEGISWERG